MKDFLSAGSPGCPGGGAAEGPGPARAPRAVPAAAAAAAPDPQNESGGREENPQGQPGMGEGQSINQSIDGEWQGFGGCFFCIS